MHGVSQTCTERSRSRERRGENIFLSLFLSALSVYHCVLVLWDFVGSGVEALAGSRECVPAKASTPPELLSGVEALAGSRECVPAEASTPPELLSGVEALAGSRECVPAEASTPPEFPKTLCLLCVTLCPIYEEE